jgi:hypothetical protein
VGLFLTKFTVAFYRSFALCASVGPKVRNSSIFLDAASTETNSFTTQFQESIISLVNKVFDFAAVELSSR